MIEARNLSVIILMQSGADDGRRKGISPKRKSPVAFLSGHAVKSCMTVIIIGGVLSVILKFIHVDSRRFVPAVINFIG